LVHPARLQTGSKIRYTTASACVIMARETMVNARVAAY